MRADITSIPISEVFEPKDGCPICRLHAILEERMASYITGPAMMEPDIRQETNRLGFCHGHYRKLLAQRKRLSVGLILESHLKELEKNAFTTSLTGKLKGMQAKAKEDCFVCQQLDTSMNQLISNTCHLWAREKDFRALYAEQPYFCLPHGRMLVNTALSVMPKKLQPDFQQITAERTRQYLQTLQEDVSHFCKMFDYRSDKSEENWGNAKDSIERAIAFLTAEEIE